MSDYISREAFKKKYLCCGYLPEMSEKEFDEFPSANVEPVRHGKWRLVRRMAACGEYECSVCGRIETFGCFNKPEHNPYCHCGAKMDLEDENNENFSK